MTLVSGDFAVVVFPGNCLLNDKCLKAVNFRNVCILLNEMGNTEAEYPVSIG